MNSEQFFNDIKTYKFLANKSLGQNFLCSKDIAEKITNALRVQPEDNVLEIGAGLGSLSYFLVKNNAQISLIDVDDNMVNELNNKFSSYKNVNIYRKNILKTDLSVYSKIIGNLPYYITSSIIEKILLDGINSKLIVLMVQKEVYLKLTDKNEISPLSLLLHYVADVSSMCVVGRNNFTPVPHVDSAYFVITPNNNIKDQQNNLLYKLMCKLFLYKRKTILNNLTKLIGDKEVATEILEKSQIDLMKRPEHLSIDQYINLLNILKSYDFINKIM